MKKKSYNPFKMLGSYIGAISLWLGSNIFGNDYFNFFYLKIWQEILRLPSWSGSYIFLTVVLGFLIGWGIHSLIRRYKK